jgi:hypothetical protein
VYEGIMPNRRTRWHSRAVCALELPTGSLGRGAVGVGDRIACEETAE